VREVDVDAEGEAKRGEKIRIMKPENILTF
jgi:hypothetical protein